MKILVVGGGGREHALVWRLSKSPAVKQIIAAPGNSGMAGLATCVPAPAAVGGYAEIASAYGVDLTVVGPEAPLVAGIVDEFRRRRLKILGPSQAAAQLEGSKVFAKRFFERAGIPTARSIQTDSHQAAFDALARFPLPVVIKADGLHAGKGVVIAEDEAEARAAIEKWGPTLVIEEYLEGEEVSFIGITNGHFLIPFSPSQDHKRLLDGDHGPNTGGMGAYADARILNAADTGVIMDRIILPTLHQMRSDGVPFTGFLYGGLMMTSEGPKILEYNVRMGDPETQAILYGFQGDFAELINLVVNGIGGVKGGMWGECSVCITLAAEHYPGTPVSGDEITGIADAEATGAIVFHAGAKQSGDRLVTSGGRVLGVTAGGATLDSAIRNAYAAAAKIHFRGMHYRTDIGQKGLRRW